MGLGLLTIPYAVQKGGWTALGLLALLVPLFGFSGQLICTAFDCLPPRAPRSYPELGRVAAGAAGQRAVLVFCGLELFGATVMLLMVAWQMLELLLPTEGARGGWARGGRGVGWRTQQPWDAHAPSATHEQGARSSSRRQPQPCEPLAGLGPLHPTQLAAVLTTAGLAPLLFSELRRLGPLAMLGSASTALVRPCSGHWGWNRLLLLLWARPGRRSAAMEPPPTCQPTTAALPPLY